MNPVTFFEFLYLNLYLVLGNNKIFDISKQNENFSILLTLY